MSRERPVNIAFVGAGAVGCFYASKLHHPSHNINVSLIARSNYKVLARSGVRMLTHSFGDYSFVPAAVYPSVSAASTVSGQAPTSAAQPPQDGWDYVIVTTKALPDRVDDAATIEPVVTPGKTCIVLIQNGVGVEAPYRERFPTNPIVSAVTVVSAELVDPGTVRQNRWTRLYLGPYVDSAAYSAEGAIGTASTTRKRPVEPELGRKLNAAGSRCVTDLTDWWTRLGQIKDVESFADDEMGLQTVRWHKLVINAAFNPSAVLSGGRNSAQMATDPELRRHLRGIMDEIFAAAPRVLGRPFPPELATPEKILASNERNLASKGPSMLLDWQAGRPLELEVIVGNPVRIARAKGVEMPRLQTVYALLKSIQDARLQKAKNGKL